MADGVERLNLALADRYRVERELGAGGMATVYLAQDLKHERKVAIKVLRSELAAVLGAERFVQEIKTTAQLQHPNILPLFDSGAADGFLFYVMPYVEGETLREKLDRETQLAIDESVRITREVADALDYAHRHGIIHRDIKPENILLHDGRPMVADFGIALAVSAAAGGRMTETGTSVGTPHYMAPEQATGDRQITGRADIYSLASVLYEMLAGEPPHTGASAQAVIMKIITDTPRPVTELRKLVPPNVAAAVAQALEKLPADRFGSAAAFSAALSDPAFAGAGVTAAHLKPATSRVDMSRLAQLGGSVALGAVATALGFLLMRSAPPPAKVVQFPFTVGPHHALALQGDDNAPFAVSPDGTRIVYSAFDSGQGGVQGLRLYVRSLDQLDGTPLQGTEDGVAPFFSPDGLWVGFVTERDGKLKKVPASGGPVTTLAEDVMDRLGGGTWGDDGYIVYTDRTRNLSRVADTGGVPERLTGTRGAGRGVSESTIFVGYYLWPSVLPGGRAVLAGRCEAGCTRNQLVVVDVVTRSVDVIVPGATQGWYIETGYLIYGTVEGAMFAVRFDPARRQTIGSPVPVLDHVLTGFSYGARMAVSRAGVLVDARAGPASSAMQVVDLDRTGRETVVIPAAGPYHHPRWSPTRDRIALTSQRGDSLQIWLYDVGSGTLSQLTSEGQNQRPTWSPDGKRLAFFSQRGENADLVWMPADGSAPAERVAEGEDVINISTTYWTRDGNWIVFDGVADSSRTDEDVFAVGTGTDRSRQPVVVTPAYDEAGAVSPDGQWVAYESTEGGEAGDYQVWVRPFLKPGGRWLVSTGRGWAPLWSSNSELIYVDPVRDSVVAARLDFTAGVHVTSRTSLFSWAPYLSSTFSPEHDVSRDGQHILALRTPNVDLQETVPTVVVLNWFEEVRQRVSARSGSRQ